MHIAIIGLGPAGAVLAHRAVTRGWQVDGYDPACVEGPGGEVRAPVWRSTYGVSLRDLPQWARTEMTFGAVSADLLVHTPAPRRLRNWDYAMIDRARSREGLTRGVRMHRQRVTDLSPPALGVDVVVDCRGVVDRPGSIRQVAYGAVVSREQAESWGLGDAEFMDWRPAVADGPDGTDQDAPPSFLYIQPVEKGILLEETVLATRQRTRDLLPPLRERLHRRIPGLAPDGSKDTIIDTETVHFPMDRRRRGWYTGVHDGVAVFGAAGGLIHPATGYSVAAAAGTAEQMLDLIETGSLPRSARISAATAYHLRRFGAELIVRTDQEALLRFFDAFFRLPHRRQSDYLAGQHGGRVALTMLSLAKYPRQVLPFLRQSPAALRAVLNVRTPFRSPRQN
ncbi:MAG TPA: hypothetical protein H9870_00060 [Candidatus Corynebacterium avicola]|uniref:Lycopene cyclase n=1 Tax=Candidatus Corynebacterium avicola TaxID=2838527 RepID=A0A9D1RM08_9CORY|nr:hypothetical protein [Candidatus Corynebacterium avicola]